MAGTNGATNGGTTVADAIKPAPMTWEEVREQIGRAIDLAEDIPVIYPGSGGIAVADALRDLAARIDAAGIQPDSQPDPRESPYVRVVELTDEEKSGVREYQVGKLADIDKSELDRRLAEARRFRADWADARPAVTVNESALAELARVTKERDDIAKERDRLARDLEIERNIRLSGEKEHDSRILRIATARDAIKAELEAFRDSIRVTNIRRVEKERDELKSECERLRGHVDYWRNAAKHNAHVASEIANGRGRAEDYRPPVAEPPSTEEDLNRTDPANVPQFLREDRPLPNVLGIDDLKARVERLERLVAERPASIGATYVRPEFHVEDDA